MYVPHIGAFIQRDPLRQGDSLLVYTDVVVTDLNRSAASNLVRKGTRSELLRELDDEGDLESNLYEYCGGNPVNRIDPDGLDWDSCALKFFKCKWKGRAGERLFCHYRCRCPCDEKGDFVEMVVEVRPCGKDGGEDRDICVAATTRKLAICKGDCSGARGDGPPSC